MPPKETPAARKAREKAEKFAAQQFQERLDVELEEERARGGNVELLERLARTEARLHFFETMAQPSARLMVPHTSFEALRSTMQAEGGLSAQRLLAMQVELRRVERGGAQLQQELVHLRGEVRNVIAHNHQSLAGVNAKVDGALQQYIAALDASVLNQRNDYEVCATALNTVLLESRRRHVELARKAQEEAQAMTQLWAEATSIHTRIPPRIRTTLQALDKDELLLILDTLSFEAVVQRYLLYRFSPGRDEPFAAERSDQQLLAAAPTGPEL
jgi:hypothetical protein